MISNRLQMAEGRFAEKPLRTALQIVLIAMLLHATLHPPCIEREEVPSAHSATQTVDTPVELGSADCPCGDDAGGDESHHQCVCPCHLSLMVQAFHAPPAVFTGHEAPLLWSGRPVAYIVPTETPPPRHS